MGAPLWTCKQTSKHGEETYITAKDQEIQVCCLLAKQCWHCFGTLMDPSSSTSRVMDRWPTVHSIVQPTVHSTCRGML